MNRAQQFCLFIETTLLKSLKLDHLEVGTQENKKQNGMAS